MAEVVLRRDADAERRRSLVTPEGVDLSLRLADGGQRVGAFMIDLLIMAGALVTMTVLLIVVLVGLIGYGLAAVEGVAIVWLLGFFLLRNFYFVLMEMGPRAATFGKRALGLRVVARSGERLTADRVIVRNLMREIEFYLPVTFLFYNSAEGTIGSPIAIAGFVWTAIFLFFPLFNRDRMRVGDLLAGTWVISAPPRKLSVDLLDARAEREGWQFSEAQLDVYGVYELQTLERVLRESDPRADRDRRRGDPRQDRALGRRRFRLPPRLLRRQPGADGARPAVRQAPRGQARQVGLNPRSSSQRNEWAPRPPDGA